MGSGASLPDKGPTIFQKMQRTWVSYMASPAPLVFPAPSASSQSRPLSACGVSMAWLSHFVTTVPDGYSTADVVTNIVKGHTGTHRFVDACVEPCNVGVPKHFVSHCWSSSFHSLVKQLQSYFQDSTSPEFVWLDIFAINQNPGQDQQDDLQNLQTVIGRCEHTLLLLDKEGKTLTRVWCLYEVWRTVSLKSAEHLLVLSHDVDATQLTDVYNNLDVAKAEATVASDRDKILNDIQASIGHAELNHILRHALVDSAIAEGERAKEDEVHHAYTEEDRADTLNKCGNMLRLYGHPDEALPMYRLANKLRTALLGEEHADAVTSLSNLAVCLDDSHCSREAEDLHRKALALRMKIFGEKHQDTAASLNSLAVCLTDQRRAPEAEPLYQHAYDLRLDLLGPEHPATISTLSSLAVCLDEQSKSVEAEVLHRRVVDLRKRLLGPNHPDTARSKNLLAINLFDQGKIYEAEPLYRAVIDVRTQLLGEEHRDTVNSMSNLAICLHEQDRPDDALPLYVEVVRRRSLLLGLDHPDTIESISNLKACRQECGQVG